MKLVVQKTFLGSNCVQQSWPRTPGPSKKRRLFDNDLLKMFALIYFETRIGKNVNNAQYYIK